MMQDRAFEVTKAVREAVGPDIDMMIETHAMMNVQMAVRMAERLAPLGMTWYEEPAGPENADTLRALRERLPGNVSICVGERHYTRHGFRPVLEQHICDIIMPDITRCGGPSEMKRIATMAEAYNVLVAPHNPNGPLCTLASAHVCASIPNFFRCEFMNNDVPWRDEVISHPLDVRDGQPASLRPSRAWAWIWSRRNSKSTPACGAAMRGRTFTSETTTSDIMTHRERVQTALAHEQPDRVPLEMSFTPEFARRLRDHFFGEAGGYHNPHGGGNDYALERALDLDVLLSSVGWANSYYAGEIYNPGAGHYTDEWGIGWKNVAYETRFGAGILHRVLRPAAGG